MFALFRPLSPWLLLALLAPAAARAQSPPPAVPPAASPNALVPPSPIERADAVFPEGAPGKVVDVTLAVEVRVDGTVGAIQVVDSGGPSFDAAAMTAALQWKFVPATRAGQPIPSRIHLGFHFEPPVKAEEQKGQPVDQKGQPVDQKGQPVYQKGQPVYQKGQPVDQKGDDATLKGQPVTLTGDAATQPPPAPTPAVIEVENVGRRPTPSRGAADFNIKLDALGKVPRQNAADAIKLAPGILITNEGGEGHADQIFLLGFDAREGQDIEMTANGVPVNESGNGHGNGLADSNFIIPELISSLRVLEGPFDPRQGNYASAGSVGYELGLAQRGVTAKFSAGSFDTQRMLLTWGPGGSSNGTFAAVELYQTAGFGSNRDGRRGSAMAQWETRFGASILRIGTQAYAASFHSAGVIRQDDYAAGRVGFYGTYDPNQGADTSRYSVWADLETHYDQLVIRNEIYGVARPMRLRENFTGFLLDVQQPWQSTHSQRGDLIDLSVMEYTMGAHGSARVTGALFGQRQELEVGYFARGDFVHSTQNRIENATNAPYATDSDLESKLGDIGLYADANLKPWSWLTLRGGVRADLFTFDVLDLCAVRSPEGKQPADEPPGDTPCLSQGNMGEYREPQQRSTTSGLAIMPRAALLLGPWKDVQASASYGEGVRSVDPAYVHQDGATPFASAKWVNAGLTFAHRFGLGDQPLDLGLRSSFFEARVDHDLQFSETEGRNVLCGPTQRDGVLGTARATNRFLDLSANFTYVHAVSTDPSPTACAPLGSLIPYIPPVVFRFDGTLYGKVPRLLLREKPFIASLSAGVSYVAPRPLPGNERSDTIFTADAGGHVGWWLFDLGISITNLLDTQYRLGEYNYASDFHTAPGQTPTLVPSRHFAAGAPRAVMFSLAINLGGGK